MVVELYPHQQKALEEMKNGCILSGGVGTGKSLTALAYFYTQVAGGGIKIPNKSEWEAPQTPVDLYIITTAKKRDSLEWEHDATHFLLSTKPELSISGIRVVVDSWNNIEKYVAVKGAFFIFDEQRLVGSGAWVKSFIKIAAANEWVLLSATPGDTWMDYVPVFVANGYYKNRTAFIRQHVVYKNFSKFPIIDRYVETAKLQKLRYRLLVEMPYERHTIRHVEEVFVDYDEALFERVWKDRWHVYEDRPLRDVGEMFSVARRVVNSDESRVNMVESLLTKHPRLIVFYNFNYELEALRTLTRRLQTDGSTTSISTTTTSPSLPEKRTRPTKPVSRSDRKDSEKSDSTTWAIQVAEWNGQKHEPIPEGDRWIYLVQYTAGAEGWNCIATDAELFYSLNYSWKVNEQARGRIDRMTTPYTDLHYYILQSRAPIDKAIKRSLREKKNFNEKKYAAEHLELAA